MNKDGSYCVENLEYITDEQGNIILDGDSPKTQVMGENTGNKTIITPGEDDEENLPEVCKITPTDYYMSTNLNNKHTSFEKVGTSILNRLGFPAVSVPDLHRDMLYEAISEACEFFTKYAGFREEYLVIDSRLYEPNKGIRLDKLFSVASVQETHKTGVPQRFMNRSFDQRLERPKDVYVTKVRIPTIDYYVSNKEFELLEKNCKDIDRELLCHLKDLSHRFPNGIEELSIISGYLYEFLISKRGYTKEQFKKSKNQIVTEGGEELTIYAEDETYGQWREDLYYENSYDYDMMDYRKVVDVKNWYEGHSLSVTSLFSTEFALAEQAYYSYQFSIRGFDMVSWMNLNLMLDTRNKMLALNRDYKFDDYTQYLRFYPQPKPNTHFVGVIQAWVEKPLRDIIKERWVFKYALAICKTMIGNVRGRWGDVQMLGGGVVTGNKIGDEGNREMEKLEELLMTKNGYGDAPPPCFFIG